jgi:hypothetical protein
LSSLHVRDRLSQIPSSQFKDQGNHLPLNKFKLAQAQASGSKVIELTPSSILTLSASAIICTLRIVLDESRGLNRNFEQREARGSMILITTTSFNQLLSPLF